MTMDVCSAARQNRSYSFGFLQDQHQIGITSTMSARSDAHAVIPIRQYPPQQACRDQGGSAAHTSLRHKPMHSAQCQVYACSRLSTDFKHLRASLAF
jgi:hypothetical protein